MLHGIRACPTIPAQHTTPTGAISQVLYTPFQFCIIIQLDRSAFQPGAHTEYHIV